MKCPLTRTRVFFFSMVCLALSTSSWSQAPDASLPDPLRFYNKYETVWEVVRATLTDLQFDIQTEDRSGGNIRTKYVDFSTGSLSASDLVKFCNPPQLTDANWVKARYSVETILERVNPREVLFTANVTVEGSKRDFQSQESWVPCPSNGTLERRIYSKVGSRLLGNDFKVPQKKGFWDKSPQPVPGTRTEPTPVPKPDRPPPPSQRS